MSDEAIALAFDVIEANCAPYMFKVETTMHNMPHARTRG